MADPYGNPTLSSGSGLSDNVAGGLAYFTFIPALIFLLIEPYKSRPFVRFNCFQCLIIAITQVVISLLYFIPIIHFIAAIISFLLTILLIIACIMAFLGKKFVVPVVGNIAQNYANGSAL